MHPSAQSPSGVEYEPPAPLLREDPDLGRGLPDDVLRQIKPRLLARVVGITEGRWASPWLPESSEEPADELPQVGLLVLEGLLMREVRVRLETARRHGGGVNVELLGPGDFLRPWQDDEGELLRCASNWHVFQPARLALIDHRILRAASRWPEIVDELLARSVGRSRWLTVTMAVTSAGTARERLLLSFEHLADRWGRMTLQGIVIPLPLTHRLLAQLTGMTRPTCSSALSWLARHELMGRRPDGAWWLRPDARERLDRLLEAEAGSA